MSERKEFKTETKRLLDLMINSIYTNKEIFLRELISNASDAIDKYHYLSLQDNNLEKRSDYKIKIEVNNEERTITISDNGIGMTYDEVVNNLGTIASSGSLEFIKKLEENKEEEIDIIGQFGVGFYSAFMVANKVEVTTKSPYSDKGYKFISEGTESYEISEVDGLDIGTRIELKLKDDTEDIKYSEYLNEYKIRELVKKYSDYIKYPIKMSVTSNKPKKDENGNNVEGEYESVQELKTINSMLPIWKKNKSEVTEEELNNFYKSKFMDYQDPITSIHVNVEGMLTYNALLFIPKKPMFDFNNQN